MSITGVILAGGLSSRMGTDKSFVLYNGNEMIWHAIQILKPITSEIVISANQSTYEKYTLPIIRDVYKRKGPLGGLHAACASVKTSVIITIPCDVPHVTTQVFDELLKYIDQYDAVIPVHSGGKKEPLIACYKTNLKSKIEDAIENNSLKLHDFLASIHVKYIEFDNADLFKNINSQSDLL